MEYIQARNRGIDHIPIDGRLYLPFTVMDPTDPSSICSVVAQVLELVETNDDDDDDDNPFEITTITGGITNKLFKVDIPTAAAVSQSVLVRVFGAEGMIDRDIETATYAALARAGMAPPYYGRFANGRIEGWKDMRPLQVQELNLPHIRRKIATALAHLHTQFQVPHHLVPYYQEPSLFQQLNQWCQQAQQVTFKTLHDMERAAQLCLSGTFHELEWLQSLIPPHEARIAFCHNDALAANILYNNDTDDIQLIDFEYGGLNYIAFDIANHWNEYAGGTDTGIPNYDWFPSIEDQKDFLKAYCQASNDDSDQEQLWNDVQSFVLANHLYWGLWAVNQAATEGCQDFDYLLYARHRMTKYQQCKQDYEKKGNVVTE